MSRPTSAPHRRFGGDGAGQGLIELALMLPLLLLMLLGVADLGRGFYYSVAVSGAAREAALSAARDPGGSISVTALRQRVCDETGWVPFADAAACAALISLDVRCVTNDPTVAVANPKVSVRVSYHWKLASFYLAPIIGDPATTSVLVTYEMTNETEVPCTAP